MTILAVGGIGGAVAFAVGALGPWARTPVVSISGWALIGYPLVLAAVVVAVLLVAYVVTGHRMWLWLVTCSSLLLVVVSLLLATAVELLSDAGSLLKLILDESGKGDLLGNQDALSVAWGVWVMCVASIALLAFAVYGLVVPTRTRPEQVSAAAHRAEPPEGNFWDVPE